jgi:hypothetical protein
VPNKQIVEIGTSHNSDVVGDIVDIRSGKTAPKENAIAERTAACNDALLRLMLIVVLSHLINEAISVCSIHLRCLKALAYMYNLDVLQR